MTAGDVVRDVLAVTAALGLPGVLIWFVRDRRKTRAEADVAQGTADSEIAIKGVAALEAHLVLVERAFESERASKDRQLADQQAQISQLRADLDHKDAVIAELKSEIEELQQRLTSVRDRLTELTDTTPEEAR